MVIDERTRISLYAVACSLPFLIGAVLWMSSVASDASTAKNEVNSLKKLVLQTRDTVVRIEERVKLLKGR